MNKPTVQIKDYAFIGNILVGTALNHPRAPDGGECEVRTSTIVRRDGRLVETKNTIYELVGDPA